MIPASRIQFDRNPADTTHQLIGNSPKRFSLTFIPPQAGTVTISNDSPAVANEGVVLTAGQTPITLRADIHGDCVQDEWYVVYSGGATRLGYIEAIM